MNPGRLLFEGIRVLLGLVHTTIKRLLGTPVIRNLFTDNNFKTFIPEANIKDAVLAISTQSTQPNTLQILEHLKPNKKTRGV